MIKRIAIMLTICLLATQVSLGDPFEDLAKYEYDGAGGNAGEKMEKLIQDTKVADYGKVEDSLLAIVSS